MRRVAVLIAILGLLAVPATVFAQEEFTADLTADAEVPAPTVPSGYEGSGSGTFTISDDESEIDYQVSYENLTGAPVASHIHYGAAGVAGGVILPLDLGADPGTSGTFSGTLTEADFTPVDGGPQSFAESLDAIRAGNTYINIHTEQNPPGELRGQLLSGELPDTSTAETQPPAGGTFPTALLLLLAGATALIVGLRRFAVIRA
jgi:hypothetical protein